MEKSLQEEQQIKKMPTKKVAMIKKMPKLQQEQVEGLIDAIGAVGLEEFIDYIRSPCRCSGPILSRG